MRWVENCDLPISSSGYGATNGGCHAHGIACFEGDTTAVVYFASFAVVVGAFKTVYAHSLRTGLLIAGTAFFSGTLGFIYSVWRLYRPRWSVSA